MSIAVVERRGEAGAVERLRPRTCGMQRTLRAAVPCRGVGVHGGARVGMTLLPAPAGRGIVFQRTDLGGGPAAMVPARWDFVSDTTLCTQLENAAGVRVRTVEHLMAALAAAGVDNVLVQVDGPELPIMDGSARDFCGLIGRVGTAPQAIRRRPVRVLKPVEVREGGAWARLVPADRFSVSCTIRYDHPHIGVQHYDFDPSREDFAEGVGRARTFCLMNDIAGMRARGLAMGGSLGNAVVVSDEGVVNGGGLRFPDEFVRHKVLDAIGDLALAGAPILGRFEGDRSGHGLNHRVLAALFGDAAAWDRGEDAPEAGPRRATA